MKCKHCNGTGTTNWCVNGTFVDCPYCGGTGEMEVEMTNDEWRRTCSAEEFAKWIYDLIMHDGNTEWYEDLLDYREDTMDYRADYHLIEKWLKQPHKEKHNE